MNIKSEFLSQAIVTLLNYRIEQEEVSSRLYLSMSLWLTNKGYMGAGKLFKKYSDEEMFHAEKAKLLLIANGIKPQTPNLNQPIEDFRGLPQILEDSYKHESEITKQCYALTKSAFDEENYMVADLGMWYCREQLEELGKIQKLINRLDAFGKDAEALRELDDEMGKLAESTSL